MPRFQFESVGMGNEYDLMVERVNTQLRLCEQLPKRAMEPAPRNPGAVFATMGISDLPDRRGTSLFFILIDPFD